MTTHRSDAGRLAGRGAGRWRRIWSFSMAGLAISCGGDSSGTTNPPPPTPVVTTVQVSPDAAPLSVGDSLLLQVTVKDQFGATMAVSVTWSSSATTVATVSAGGVVTGVGAGSATITATAQGKSGTAALSVSTPPRLVVDERSRVTGKIGSLGGTLSTTVGGATYTLDVPPGSLLAERTITMTPVTALRDLPAEGAFVAGVMFEPSGLTFPKAATLRVVQHVPSVAGKALIGYLANDTGEVIAFEPISQSGDTLTVRVPHFTIAGWGQFTPPLVPPVAAALPTSSGAQGYFNQLSALPKGTPMATVLGIMQQWYDTLVEPALSNVTGNTTDENEQAAHEFDTWMLAMATFDFTLGYNLALVAALQPEQQAGIALARPVLTFAIAGIANDCDASKFGLDFAERIFVLQELAAGWGLATAANGLDLPSVLGVLNTCVRVINTVASFPANPTPNVSALLDLRYGLQVGTNPATLDVPFKVTLSFSGTTTDGTQVTQTDAIGKISGNVVPTGQQAFVADVATCVHPVMGYRVEEICMHHQVTRSFGVTITGSVVVLSQVGLQQISNAAKITGSLTLQSTPSNPITSTDLKELSQLTEVGGALVIGGLPSLQNVNGLRSLTKVGTTLTVGQNPLLTDLGGLASLASVSGVIVTGNPLLATLNGLQGIRALDNLQIESSAALTNIGGLQGLGSVKRILMIDLPQVTSLQALRSTAITEELVVRHVDALTTMRDLNALAPAVRQVIIEDNAALTDLAALANVTSVQQNLTIARNNMLPDLHELAALRTVGTATSGVGSLTVSGKLLTSLAGLAGLQRVTNLRLDLFESPVLSTISLPSLTSTVGTGSVVSIGGGDCSTGRQIAVSFPVLATAGGVQISAGQAGSGVNCSLSVSLPSLTNATGLGLGAVSSITLAGSFTGQSFAISGTNLTAVSVPALSVDDLLINSNLRLSGLGGGGGTVRRNLRIDGNPKLSTQAATLWADSFNHTGALVQITNNKIP